MTNFAKPSALPTFNPNDIPRHRVIRLKYKFQGQAQAEYKRFVVLGHVNGHAICVKATSQTLLYESDRSQMAGCVFYKQGEADCFEEDTAIQIDNQIPIPHSVISQSHKDGELTISELPEGFLERAKTALKNSVTLTGRERQRLSKMLI